MYPTHDGLSAFRLFESAYSGPVVMEHGQGSPDTLSDIFNPALSTFPAMP